LHFLHGGSRVDKVAADAAQATADALAHVKSQIEDLSARLDRAQVLDLRWAILGLFITVVGIALSYWEKNVSLRSQRYRRHPE
jgi:hypothetical protein